jgi:hypothetical protein
MASARTGQYAVRLGTGKVLIVGGDTSRTAELYDPATNTWTAAGSLSIQAHSATLLNNGKVLAVGGSGTGTSQLSWRW